MKLASCFAVAALLWLAWAGSPLTFAADGNNLTAVNSSVSAQDGQTYGTLSTVNGDVSVGRGAIAQEARTVNGSIHLEADARVGEAHTVNGSLHLSEGVTIERELDTVNGNIDMRKRTRVGGDVATVSGEIEMEGGEVGGELRTVNGDIELTEGAHVRGGIYVKKSKGAGWSWGKDDPVKVRICATCVVEGDLRFEKPVELRVESGARIGKVIGDSVIRK